MLAALPRMDDFSIRFDTDCLEVVWNRMDFNDASGLQICSILRPGKAYPIGGQGVNKFDDGLANALSTNHDTAREDVQRRLQQICPFIQNNCTTILRGLCASLCECGLVVDVVIGDAAEITDVHTVRNRRNAAFHAAMRPIRIDDAVWTDDIRRRQFFCFGRLDVVLRLPWRLFHGWNRFHL